MGNERREPGDSEIDNLYYLAHYQASEDRLLQCEALLALVVPDVVTATAAQKTRLLKEVLTAFVKRDTDRGVEVAREARKTNKPLTASQTFPCAAVGELLGLVDSDASLDLAHARKFDSNFIERLAQNSVPKRRRQARASAWMGVGNVKYYSGRDAERELLSTFLNLLTDELKTEEFRRRMATFLKNVVDEESVRSIPQIPAARTVPPASDVDSSREWMPWVWRAAIPVVLVFAVVVGIAVYNKAQSSDSCAPGDASCLPFSILVETDLDRIAPGIPVGAYLFKPGAFAAAPKKPSCADGYRTQEWARQHGGVPAGLQYVRVSITSKDKPILVNFAEVEANYMTNHPGDVATCLDGTQLDVRQLAVDTDRETTTYYSRFDTQRGLVSEPLALHIAPGEAEVIVVSVKATTKDTSWHLKLGMDIDGERIEHVIRDTNGQDFQLAASEESGRTTYTETAPYRWEVLDW